MKNNNIRRQRASIAKPRWVAYAAAGAATALGGSHSLEAAIHYSGRLNVLFPPDEFTLEAFQLDQPTDQLFFIHKDFGSYAGFNIQSFSSFFNGFRGYGSFVSKLSFGQNISAGSFRHSSRSYFGIMAIDSRGQWTDPVRGFVGFRFKNGAGIHYGWARIRMGGTDKKNGFKVLDYAYADADEPIRAGQTSSDEQAIEQNPLGWLALGAAGLLAWRKNRGR